MREICLIFDVTFAFDDFEKFAITPASRADTSVNGREGRKERRKKGKREKCWNRTASQRRNSKRSGKTITDTFPPSNRGHGYRVEPPFRVMPVTQISSRAILTAEIVPGSGARNIVADPAARVADGAPTCVWIHGHSLHMGSLLLLTTSAGRELFRCRTTLYTVRQ